jgi:hypothetical protein
MECYPVFNRFVFESFFGVETAGNYVTLCVDEKCLQDFCRQENMALEDFYRDIEHSVLFKEDWGWVEKEIEAEIPLFLGLIVLQVFAAYQMREGEVTEKIVTERAYNERLKELLKIPDNNQLQKLYSRYQERIWEKLKVWSESRQMLMRIPEPKTGYGRFVQYPLSQALLNRNDLEHLPLVFRKRGLQAGEDLDLSDFKALWGESVESNLLPRHFYRVKSQLKENGEEEALWRQMFACYTQWDGEVPEENQKGNKTGYKKGGQTEHSRKYWVVDENFSSLTLRKNNDSEIVADITLDDSQLWEKISQYVSLSVNGQLRFTRDKIYNDWIECRYFTEGEEGLILSKRMLFMQDIVQEEYQIKKIANDRYFLYQILISSKEVCEGRFKNYFSVSAAKIEFVGGLRIGRKIWMEGAGPLVRVANNKRVWLNGKRVTPDENGTLFFTFSPLGDYTLVVEDHTPVCFYIREPELQTEYVNKGWKISRDSPPFLYSDKDWCMLGMGMHERLMEQESVYRSWLETVINRRPGRYSSPLMKTQFNRRKYGKK